MRRHKKNGDFYLKKKLRIGINAQIPASSGTGGIETVLRVLTSLGQLDGDEEYIFIGHWADSDWLKPLLSERQKIVQASRPEVPPEPNLKKNFKRVINPLLPAARRVREFLKPPQNQIVVPTSDGFYESLNCDVIHFPYQDYVYCRVPTVYNPHDLQHLHFQQFFTPEQVKQREIIYLAACRAARLVTVASEFIKLDIIKNYGIEANKIQVIQWSPPQLKMEDFADINGDFLFEKYKCPPRPFALYPAMSWEHKNHIRLLEAVALLRERENLIINLVCTGSKNSFYPRIEQRLRELNLENQIRFTGIVEYNELCFFYRQAQFVVVPTLYEAASGLLFEAWQHHAAAACSSVTSLPEQAADAALLFDPFSVEAIADALKKMATDDKLRSMLRAKGSQRLQNFSLERTAKSYRAAYRKAGGAELTEEDRDLLN